MRKLLDIHVATIQFWLPFNSEGVGFSGMDCAGSVAAVPDPDAAEAAVSEELKADEMSNGMGGDDVEAAGGDSGDVMTTTGVGQENTGQENCEESSPMAVEGVTSSPVVKPSPGLVEEVKYSEENSQTVDPKEDVVDGATEMQDADVSHLTTETWESCLSDIVSKSDMMVLTRKLARNELEKRLGLPIGSLETRRKEVNHFLDAILLRGEDASIPPPTDGSKPEGNDAVAKAESETSSSESGPAPTSRSRRGRAAAPRKRKRSDDRAASESDSSPSSESAQDSSEEETSSEEEAPSRRKPAARRTVAPKKAVKRIQGSLMTKTAFLADAVELPTKMGHMEFTMTPRTFSTGSSGWFYGQKVQIPVGSKEVTCQLTVNMTVVGSKTWKEGKKR